MTVDSEKLRQTLDQLHQQLEEAESLDPEVAARLRATIDDIRTTLERQGVVTEATSPAAEITPLDTAAPTEETVVEETVVEEEVAESEEEEPTFAERLTEAEQHFESSHPTLSNTLQRLVDILAQMGI